MEYDVVVVGGGPAGLSAAYTAAQSGARVVLLERSKEIGYPVHTSGGSWIAELKRLGVPDRFMHPIRVGQFISAREEAVFEYSDPPGCILDVRGLYQYLAEMASLAGAEIFVNTVATKPIFESGTLAGVKARRFGREQIFRAPLVVDASGASCLVARHLGLTTGFDRVGVGAEYDLVAPHWPQDRVAFLFGTQVAPSGYAWIFPHGQQRVRCGVGLIHPDSDCDPRTYLEKLLANPNLLDGALNAISRIEYHAGVIPSENFLKRTVTDGMMVVGDAGGLISTLLGEGIRFAIEIGRMAGNVAGKALTCKRFDAPFLGQFESLWQKKYKRIFRLGAFLNRRMARYTDAQWDRRVRTLAALGAELVPAVLKGEFSSRNILKIVRKNPGFLTKTVALALASLWKNP
ncbi:MAG: NAD(P)/FAD-dependent oxidoreductase [bacterium]